MSQMLNCNTFEKKLSSQVAVRVLNHLKLKSPFLKPPPPAGSGVPGNANCKSTVEQKSLTSPKATTLKSHRMWIDWMAAGHKAQTSENAVISFHEESAPTVTDRIRFITIFVRIGTLGSPAMAQDKRQSP